MVWKYNGRGQIENHIKEIKSGFGMEWMPSGDFGANAVYFGIGILTYNLVYGSKTLDHARGMEDKDDQDCSMAAGGGGRKACLP